MSGSFVPVQLIGRLRRNHALEHATIHVLSQRYRDLQVVGRSTTQGFLLYGDLPTDGVLLAAQHALQRLQRGQRELAIHPTCGTNFVAAGVLAGLGAFTVLTPRRKGWREWLSRLPLVFLSATLGVMLGQQMGAWLQATVTTQPDVGQARVTGVVREEHGSLVVHRVRVEEP
jgi:hypothetical protein